MALTYSPFDRREWNLVVLSIGMVVVGMIVLTGLWIGLWLWFFDAR